MAQEKPELLLPAGNAESLRAAIRGGADAVYLGLKQFNARIRANNFLDKQLPAILKEAKNHQVKIYITLNTIIKNTEIEKLLDFLCYLDKVKVDAIIIQDWGVYYLAKKYFPKLQIHASTQMSNHNSLGVAYSAKLGISRVVLARELTLSELEKISYEPACELELFIHGALCYSFSGLCQFSSYIGGRGANRGLCSQPCRMLYKDGQQAKYIFNLKDNQQLDNLQRLTDMGIHSLKVEGRMKSADYVYQVARAYRMSIDHPESIDEAEQMLALDFGRSKTNYFLGKEVKDAIAENSNTGISVGNIIRVNNDEVVFSSNTELKNGDRLRVRNSQKDSTVSLKLEDVWEENGRYSFIHTGQDKLFAGDEVFWISRKTESFPSRLLNVPAPRANMPLHEKKTIIQKLAFSKKNRNVNLFVRIDSPEWLATAKMDEVDHLILAFTKNEFETFDFKQDFIQKNRHKIHVELPKFIAEGQISQWEKLIRKLEENGIVRFFISHLSQKLLLTPNSLISSNEQVYVFNDAAAQLLQHQNMQNFCYPIENDFENLKSMQNKDGIVLLHSIPELFYSRMPVKINSDIDQFKDDYNKSYKRHTQDGMTIVTPDRPMNLFHYKEQLIKLGFSSFMIDLKHTVPTKNAFKQIIIKYKQNNQVQPSTIFNFKKGLL